MKTRKPYRLVSLVVGSVVMLALLLASFPPLVGAGPDAIAVDGDPADWNSAWVIATDPANDTCSTGGAMACGASCPNNPNCCARSGYDLTSVSAHWESDAWYFMLRVDGLPGDADSRAGTCPSSLGIGTTGSDSGPLAVRDYSGVGNGEQYSLFLDVGNPPDSLASLQNCANPGTICGLGGDVTGSGAYGSVADDGTVEFSIPESDLFPVGQCRSVLNIFTHIGSNWDNLAEDNTTPLYVLALQFALAKSHSPATPTVGQTVYLYNDYTISGATGVPATNATIQETLDTKLTYIGCTAPSGGSCSFISGTRVFTCNLPTPLAPAANGRCTVQATVNTGGTVYSTAQLNSNEGLCATDSDDWTPTAVELASFTATPQAWTKTIRLDWETLTEVNNLGFNLYRAESPDGRQIKLNAGLIPSQGPGSPSGYIYSFVDRRVTAGRTYYYWLEAVDLSGSTQRFGPKSAAIQQLGAPRLSTP